MQLRLLKLAGFKSFVEPTVVPFSSQLIGVVGPNGCGKSNIIDAVRWVLGESSAKNLRGESMVDVIFNGSSQRKSVGQASVELVFDNSMGRLVGPYAAYQEIAVKRLVTRDGDSFYYLNGSRCRRRDITDIFLGTGAGARGYSIIGQDTISRLIEARPEDLRAYLEEAAGVSKYKERRRETLQRIGHTRENLARVADIRDELGTQLSRLERQAKAAERYKILKQEERLCRAEILALKWKALTTEQAQVHQDIYQLSLQQEQHEARITSLMKENLSLREALHQAQEEFQRIQVVFYQLNTEIARLEESIQQQQREHKRLTEDKQQVDGDAKLAIEQLKQDQLTLTACEQSVVDLQAKVLAFKVELQTHQRTLDEIEPQKTVWDAEWQQAQEALHQGLRTAQADEARLQHLGQRHQEMQLRFEKMQNDHVSELVEGLQAELAVIKKQQLTCIKQRDLDATQHQEVIQKGVNLRQELNWIEQQLHQAHDKVKASVTEQAALLAAQNAALRNTKHESSALLAWENNPRLAEMIQVPPAWLRACELVLGDGLEAIVLDSIDTLLPALVDLEGQCALFVQSREASRSTRNYPRLSDKVSGALPCGLHALDSIFAANDLSEALAWLPHLDQQESVVTADGYWFGPGWVRVSGWSADDESGVLFRQQALAQLNETLGLLQDDLSRLQLSRDQTHVQWVDSEREQLACQRALAASQDALRAVEMEMNNKQQALQHAVIRLAQLTEEQEELQLAIEDLAMQKITIDHQWREAKQVILVRQERVAELKKSKVGWENSLMASRIAATTAREALHQAELQCSKETLKTQQLRDNIEREQRHIDSLHERLQMIERRCDELMAPDQTRHAALNEKIALHHLRDSELLTCRQLTDTLQQQLNENDRLGKQQAQYSHDLQEKTQQKQLHEQGLVVRAASLVESLTELGADAGSLLDALSAEVTLYSREEALLALDEKIKRLGAINLMAIEEYQTELARKQHLDEHYLDLTDALLTLDAAIAKMDKETQLRLKDTFDQVNQSFQSLFPRLFGGGRAMLELSCDNLLEAGVLVMAQPPGKRNSSIHLLSGGEKAMTAVALVFAIFQLNPSPFCMLDEVDAPLDDLNVRRFCDLVKEMSQYVQFLFITHNKVTMELADHLIGVTMREPGVSRVVAVDVEEALAIAE